MNKYQFVELNSWMVNLKLYIFFWIEKVMHFILNNLQLLYDQDKDIIFKKIKNFMRESTD